MNSASLRLLRQKFYLLNQWRSALLSSRLPPNFDQFVLNCLQIVNVLSSNKSTVKTIAKTFSFIIECDIDHEKTVQLKSDFLAIENSLDAGLRGFVSLFDAVLEGGTIVADPKKQLQLMPKIYFPLTLPFVKFLDALAEGQDNPKILPALFLRLVNEVLSLLSRRPERVTRQQLRRWLKRWGLREPTPPFIEAHKMPAPNVAKVLRVV